MEGTVVVGTNTVTGHLRIFPAWATARPAGQKEWDVDEY